MSLVGKVGRMVIRTTVDAPEAAIELSTENGRMTFVDPGRIDLRIEAHESAVLRLRTDVYDLEGTDPAFSPEHVEARLATLEGA